MKSRFNETLVQARKRKELSQEKIAEQYFVSRSSIAKYETGDRRIPQEMVTDLTHGLDDVDLYFASWREAAGPVSIPLMNGENVNLHTSSMAFLVKKEALEALEHVEDTEWHLPTNSRKEEDVERTIHELMDAVASMMNLVGALCKEHKFSMLKVFRKWQLSMKTRGYQR